MLSGKSHDKYHAHETKQVSRKIVIAVGGALVLASLVVVVFLVANRTPTTLSPAMPPPRPISLSEAKRFSNCSDWDGVVDAVRGVAEGQGYLHAFEYERLHPCCLVRSTGFDKTEAPLSTADIVFVVMTSAKTPQKAKGVLDTWGVGLEHLLMISATADGELPPRTITPDRVAAEAGKPNPSTTAPTGAGAGAGNSGAASSGGSGGSGGGVSGGLSASALRQAMMDEQHTPIWGVKYVSASPEYSHLIETKKWFVLADDDTWVNIPALLDLAARYDYRCPVTFGYVWSKLLWGGGAHGAVGASGGGGGGGGGGSGSSSGSGAGDAREQTDYHSGGAGLLLSREAFARIAPSFYTPSCPFHHYNDITFGRCAWARGVQLVHSRGFYYDPPERSKDRHETVWLPPVAEAITYHYVQPVDMHMMTQYVNQRWQYEPSRRHGNSSGTFLSVSHSLLRNTDWEAIARQAKQPHGKL